MFQIFHPNIQCDTVGCKSVFVCCLVKISSSRLTLLPIVPYLLNGMSRCSRSSEAIVRTTSNWCQMQSNTSFVLVICKSEGGNVWSVLSGQFFHRLIGPGTKLTVRIQSTRNFSILWTVLVMALQILDSESIVIPKWSVISITVPHRHLTCPLGHYYRAIVKSHSKLSNVVVQTAMAMQ